jgi:hypothetical protein
MIIIKKTNNNKCNLFHYENNSITQNEQTQGLKYKLYILLILFYLRSVQNEFFF